MPKLETAVNESSAISRLGEKTELFLSRVKPGTAKTYRVAFDKFLTIYSEGSIDSFIKSVDEDNKKGLDQSRVAETVLIRFVDNLKSQGFARKSIRTYASALQGLGRFWRVPITLSYTNLPEDGRESKTYEWDSADSVAKFLGSFEIEHYRVLGILLFQSGLSVGDALGLRFQDVSQELGKICPLCLDYRESLRSKTGVTFLTFIGQWSISNLLGYLKGKTLGPETRLFPVTKESVDAYFRRRALAFLGSWEGRNNPCSPHSLRHGFRSLLHESKAVKDEDIEYWMGHLGNGDIHKVYTSLPVDHWRKLYEPAEKLLTPSFTLVPVKQG